MYVLTFAELYSTQTVVGLFFYGIANYRDIMYTVVLVENESYTIRHETANRSGARPRVDVHGTMPLSC